MSNGYFPVKTDNYNVGEFTFSRDEFAIIAAILKHQDEKNASICLNMPIEEVKEKTSHIIKKINGSSIDDIFGFFAAPNYLAIINKFYIEFFIQTNINKLINNILKIPYSVPTHFILDATTNSFNKKAILSNLLNQLHIATIYLEQNIQTLRYPERTIIFTNDENFKTTLETFKNNESIFICESLTDATINCYAENSSNVYSILLDVINDIIDNNKVSKLITNFKNEITQASIEDYTLNKKKSKIRTKSMVETNINKITGIVVLIIALICFGGIFYYQKFYNVPLILQNINLPDGDSLLPRTGLHNAILRSLKAQSEQETKFVVLIGAGGCGKTTAVQVFVNNQVGKLKWIINAESEGTLMNSYMELAHKLSKLTNTYQKFFMIKNIKITKEKKKQLIQYIWKSLKNIGKYHVIFDSAENIDLVTSFIPELKNNLGDGIVYFTTRNMLSNDSHYFDKNSLIYVYKLQKKEQMQLLTSVLYKNTIISTAEYNKISAFLKELLPYPLDILSAAYYIKNTSISLDEYLERMYRLRSSFENVQNSIHKSSLLYKNTRNIIITSSISSLIKQNTLFKKLLLSLTLVDSQDIPRQILYLAYPDEIVDKFILALKQNFIAEIHNDKIYVHKTVQKISQQFLAENTDYTTILDVASTLVNTIYELQNIYTNNNDNRAGVHLKIHIRSLLQKLDKILKPHDANLLKTRLYYSLAKINFDHLVNYISTVKYYNLALSSNKTANILSKMELASIEQDLGWIMLYWNQFEPSQKHINNSLEICMKSPECNDILRTNIRNLGKAAGIKGNFLLAMKYFKTALKMVGPLDNEHNKNAKAGILNQISSAYSRYYVNKKDKTLEAISILEQALELTNANEMFSLQKNPNLDKVNSWAAPSRWRIAQNYFMLQQYEEALDNLKESDFIINNCKYYKYSALQKLLNIRERAKIKLRQGKMNESLQLFNTAITLTKTSNIGMGTWKSKAYRAEVFMRMGNFKNALKDINHVLENIPGDNNYSSLLYNQTLLHAAIIHNKFSQPSATIECLQDFFKRSKQILETFATNEMRAEVDKLNLLHFDKNVSIKDGINNGIKLYAILIGKNNDVIKNHLSKYIIK